MARRTGVCVVRAEQEGDGVLIITVSSTLDVEHADVGIARQHVFALTER